MLSLITQGGYDVMIKNFFKTIGLGMKECAPLFSLFLYIGMLPALFMIIVIIFDIRIEQEALWAMTILLTFISPFITLFIHHCINAVLYAKKYNVNIEEAYKMTEDNNDNAELF